MKWSSAIVAASLGVAAAHGDHAPHMPKLVGARRFLSELNMKRALSSEEHIVSREPVMGPANAKRQPPVNKRQGGTDGQCGKGYGSCAAGYCCSAEGWCGKGTDYCSGPDCQMSYGPGCDANKKPAGADTSGVARPKLGSIPYGGAGIYDCVNTGDIAITFDDGPYLYTNDLLDKLKSYGAKATFFITGNNLGKGMINDPSTPYPNILKRMANEGHQIASHTWSHQNSSDITTTQFTNQMVWNEIAFNSVLGFFPTYMRPPYSICEKNCQTILSNLGYHVVYFDLDTEGYLHDTAATIQTSKNIWDTTMKTAKPSKDSFLQIEHDIHYQVVYNLTDYILTSLFSHGFKSVTVGECLGDPRANWYRNGPGGGSVSSSPPSSTRTPTPTPTSSKPTSSAPAPTGTLQVSQDGACGNGVTCSGSRFGTCCSLYGFCGTGDDYCLPDSGCQSTFGQCTGANGSPSSSGKTLVVSAPASSSTAALKISQDASCGNGVTCQGSVFGNCCSQHGWCGSTDAYCGSGCQAGFGSCGTQASSTPKANAVTTSSSSPNNANTKVVTSTSTTTKAAAPTLKVSTNGKCGNGVTCQGSIFGNCCSMAGLCGRLSIFCGTGCQSAFGTCNTPTPVNSITPSVNGQCGEAVGQTCTGSAFGACCGPTGRCNQNTISCLSILGCQKNYGYCI